MNTITAGRKCCLLERFTVDQYCDAIIRHRPKVAGGSPTIIRMLLDANVPRDALSSVVVFRAGTAPLDPELAKEFYNHFGIPVLQNYGATEFAGGVAGWTFEDHKKFGDTKTGSVGRLNPGIEGRITDPETGKEVAPGETGLLELKAPHIGDGVNWLKTTDIAVIDEDGFLFIRGRADGAINRGGYKISPEDVVSALESHPAIREASVVGIKDARLGQVPVAAYLLAADAEEPETEELKTYLKSRLSPYQVPVQFKAVAELPRTPSLKVDQAAVRALFEDSSKEASG